MPRKNNWPASLDYFLQEKLNEPFDWSSNNCAMFAADWVALLTGVDPAAEMRANITNAKDAAKVLKQGNILGMTDAALAQHGWHRIPILQAQRGDVCSYETEKDGHAIGVCYGQRVAFAGKNGIETKALTECSVAWRID